LRPDIESHQPIANIDPQASTSDQLKDAKWNCPNVHAINLINEVEQPKDVKEKMATFPLQSRPVNWQKRWRAPDGFTVRAP
jgi:hypothetical protein